MHKDLKVTSVYHEGSCEKVVDALTQLHYDSLATHLGGARNVLVIGDVWRSQKELESRGYIAHKEEGNM